MRSRSWLAVAAGLTVLVSAALPLGIALFLATRTAPVVPAVPPEASVLADSPPDALPPPTASFAACRTTVMPGEDVTAAIAVQPIGGVVCLARGVHRPFSVARSVSAGVVVRGEGETATIIQAQRADGVTITDVERFTLSGVTVRGGTPAGIYIARARGTALRSVRVQSSGFGVHVDDGAGLTLDDVTLSGNTDFGLLLRRRASVTGERVRVLENLGIGVGASEGATSLILRDSEVGWADPALAPAQAVVLLDVGAVRLEGGSVRGGNPAGIYAARVQQLTLRGVRVGGSVFGVQLDDGTTADLADVTVTGTGGVGLLLQRRSTVTADRLRVLESAGTGIAAVENAGAVTLRDSEVAGTTGAGIFAGIAGCGTLPPASLAVPPCFYADLASAIAGTVVTLERATVRNTQGSGLVLFPGVQAAIQDSTFADCELTGVFAWGATVRIHGGAFTQNAEHALEVRAYPDPRGDVLLVAEGALDAVTVAGTRALPSGELGGGVLAQGARLAVHESVIRDNAGIGLSFQNGSVGEVRNSRIEQNSDIGLCIAPFSVVEVSGSVVAGNRVNGIDACS